MVFEKCFNAVTDKMNQTKVFLKDNWVEDNELKLNFRNNCNKIDEFIKEINGTLYDTGIDVLSNQVIISVMCQWFEFSSESDTFLNVLDCSKNLRIIYSDVDEIIVQVSFDGMWIKNGKGVNIDE